MAYVNVPKDLTKVKTKVALNLTKRQLICFSLAAAVGIPVYFLTKGTVGNSAAIMVMAITSRAATNHRPLLKLPVTSFSQPIISGLMADPILPVALITAIPIARARRLMD